MVVYLFLCTKYIQKWSEPRTQLIGAHYTGLLLLPNRENTVYLLYIIFTHCVQYKQLMNLLDLHFSHVLGITVVMITKEKSTYMGSIPKFQELGHNILVDEPSTLKFADIMQTGVGTFHVHF
jgi:hypothetical protein